MFNARCHISAINDSCWIAQPLVYALSEHLPAQVHVATNFDDFTRHVEHVSSAGEPLDLVLIVTHPGLGFSARRAVEWIRRAPPDADLAHGERLRAVPVLVVGDRLVGEDLQSIDLPEGLTTVLLTTELEAVVNAARRTLLTRRHEVLDDLNRSGHPLVWLGNQYGPAMPAKEPWKLSRPLRLFHPRGPRFDPGTAYTRALAVGHVIAKGEAALEEFRDLTSRTGVQERLLHDFLERNPEFLQGVDYDWYWSESQLKSAEGQTIRPDMVLQPIGNRHARWRWRVVEFKRADVPLLSKASFHKEFSSDLRRGLEELRDYRRFFEDPRNAAVVSAEFGGVVPQPELTLVIGREPRNADRFAELLRNLRGEVRIETYDELFKRQQAVVQRGQAAVRLGRG